MKDSETIKKIFLYELFDNIHFNFSIKNKIYNTVFLTKTPKSNKNISERNFYDYNDNKLNNSKAFIKKILEIMKQNKRFAG